MAGRKPRRTSVPATRSRNERWKDYLDRLPERNGAIEIAVRSADNNSNADHNSLTPDVVWRVRVIACNPNALIVEQPGAFGRPLAIDTGTPLIGAMTVGQNRWMFHTRVVGHKAEHGRPPLLILELPTGVERCARRSFYRISTAKLSLPRVFCWPLLDPTTVVPAETACRASIEAALAAGMRNHNTDHNNDTLQLTLPDVGSPFEAALLNLSGGGLGLHVEPAYTSNLTSRPHLWLQVDLGPTSPGPLSVTGRVAHTHLDSTQSTYAGIAFEFGHHPEYRDFVTNLFQLYIASVQARLPTASVVA